ncbi:MAG: low molecular weight protein-tyrosine-phosphatase [Pseudomonadota bacterium]
MFFFFQRPELRVLIICTANICRSPLAAALLQSRLDAAGLSKRVSVRCRGTSVALPGRSADPRVRKLLAERGVSLGRTRSRQLSAPDLAWADRILAMERRHLAAITKIDAGAKGELLGGFAADGADAEIVDPYYASREAVENCLVRVDAALAAFVRSLQICIELD